MSNRRLNSIFLFLINKETTNATSRNNDEMVLICNPKINRLNNMNKLIKVSLSEPNSSIMPFFVLSTMNAPHVLTHSLIMFTTGLQPLFNEEGLFNSAV